MKITERTPDKLVVVNRPRLAFGIILGPLFVGGSLLLYRETTTTFDRRANLVDWQQRGLLVRKAHRGRLDQVRDVVIGRPVSDQSGGATCVSIILEDRALPLMYGFSALYRDPEVRDAIREFIASGRP